MERKCGTKQFQNTRRPQGYNRNLIETQNKTDDVFLSNVDHFKTHGRGMGNNRDTNFKRSFSTEFDRRRPRWNTSKNVPQADRVTESRTMIRQVKPELNGAFHMNTAGRPSMKTLDKKISVSFDQLDSLTSDQRRENFDHLRPGSSPHLRASYRVNRDSEICEGDVIFKYKGANYSKNQYFFGNTSDRKSQNQKSKNGNFNKEERNFRNTDISVNYEKDHSKKSPYQMFLEDDGPYSRKLFGPSALVGDERVIKTPDPKLPITHFVPKSADSFVDTDSDTRQVKKGLLWHQRDKLFSRWKERFFILTKDYFQCFRKDPSKITEMGEFIFKVKLADISGMSLLDKRGYLTICISHLKDGRMYLRKNEGIKDWFSLLKGTVYESKKRKFFHKGNCDESSHFHMDNDGGRITSNTIAEEDCAADDEDEDSDSNNNLPSGINRQTIVSDLLKSETLCHKKPHNKVYPDSGHDSGQSSMHTGPGSLSEISG